MFTRIFLRDRVVRLEDACLSPLEPAVLYGAGVFETLRVRRGVALRVSAHARRLRTGLATLGADPARLPSVRVCREAVRLLVDAEGATEAVARITAAPGGLPGGLRSAESAPWLFVHLAALPAPTDPAGVALVHAMAERDPRSPRLGIKATSYLENRLDLQRAESLGAFDALYRNGDGSVAECTRANAFFVIGGGLVTPSLDSGVLPGVMRARVLRLARRRGFDVEERKIVVPELASASECFVTNAVRGIVPVASIEDRAFPGREFARSLRRDLEADDRREIDRVLARRVGAPSERADRAEPGERGAP